MALRTCVAPSGRFVFGLHQPKYDCRNFRIRDALSPLGRCADGQCVDNRSNFPDGDLEHLTGDPVFEIPNAFPFRGTTYINQRWAERRALDPLGVRLPRQSGYSLSRLLQRSLSVKDSAGLDAFFRSLPHAVCLALATTSTDPDDLVRLAHIACRFDPSPDENTPSGLHFHRDAATRSCRPMITRPDLFEAVANNPHLPDAYKMVMVLRPGVQGGSAIVGEQGQPGDHHVWEYLRQNSYIPWGHYAANMAHDTIRYRLTDLTLDDIRGMRQLYYQRTYTRMAETLGIPLGNTRSPMPWEELEELRRRALERIKSGDGADCAFRATLWGWNFGFDYAPSGNRLHASHQQVHQQYALIPTAQMPIPEPEDKMLPFSFGDLITEFVGRYEKDTHRSFFSCYLEAIRNNTRTDGSPSGPKSLVVFEDSRVVLFVPKAQTSQWELQLMVKNNLGNILETDQSTRDSLDQAIFIAMRAFGALHAHMITTIEMSRAFQETESAQHLLYAFLPRLPESPGAFSEAQLRWINGHYPEDFAAACRAAIDEEWIT